MIRKGTLNEDVVAIQKKLTEAGHDSGPPDGWFGPVTARAVASFQRANRLFEDAIVGPETAKSLGLPIDFSKLQLPPLRGNLSAALFDPALQAKLTRVSKLGPTHYEELKCVGYNPQLDRLEAIVALKQSTGFEGNPCEGGSHEHVRFFIDRGDGHWTNAGLVSFDTHDLPFAEERMHAVQLALAPEPDECDNPILPRIRAILSWRVVPPEGDPEWSPIWGNRQEVRIQLPTRPPMIRSPYFGLKAIEAVAMAAKSAKFSLPSTATIASYQAKQVSIERWAAPQLRKLASSKAFSHVELESMAQTFNLDIEAIGKAVASLPTGSKSYERIDWLGYDSDRRTLAAVVRVEQNFGYAGSLCEPGSREYVRFWRWSGDEARWIGLGISSVEVHDVQQPDRGALSYAVVLPVDFSDLRKPCDDGPVIVRVRATLSWNEVPPAGNPDWAPSWGNSVEAYFDLEPGQATQDPDLYVEGISTQAICLLDPVSGMANDAGTLRPFGGYVLISGLFGAIGSLGPNRRLFYRVRVGNPATGGLANAETICSPFKMWMNDFTTEIPTQTLVQQLAVDGWYEYRERTKLRVHLDALAIWSTHGKNGLWAFDIDAEIRDATGKFVETIETRRLSCDGTPTSGAAIRVMLDNEAPEIKLTITGGSCHTYTKDDVIDGTYEIADEHLDLTRWGFTVEGSPTSAKVEWTPTSTSTTGVTGTWKLNTKNMTACGYVIRLGAWDRTIVGRYSQGPFSAAYYSSVGYWASTPSSGFCVVAP